MLPSTTIFTKTPSVESMIVLFTWSTVTVGIEPGSVH